MNKSFLKTHLNNFVGEGCGLIPRWALRLYGDGDWAAIKALLSEWEQNGYLIVLLDPETCDDNTVVLKMRNFVDAVDPLPLGWINEQKQPPFLK